MGSPHTVRRRRCVAGPLGALVVALWIGSAHAAPAHPRRDEAPAPTTIVVFHAPAGAPAEVIAGREAVAEAARRAGAAWIDLSPTAPAAPQAPALYRRGLDAYEALRYDDALAALDDAVTEAARTGAAGLEPQELSDLLLYRGLVRLQSGDSTAAWDDLVRAATVDPTRVLDQLRFPPRAVEAFARAATQVGKAPRGTLTIDTAETGCTIRIDARPAVATQLPHGEHYLAVDCPGARPFGAVVLLAASEQTVTAKIERDAPPAEGEVLRLARDRGAGRVLLVTVTVSGTAAPTAWLRLFASSSGRLEEQSSLALSPGGAAVDAEAATTKILRVRLKGTQTTRPGPSPWYKSPWLWTGVGAAIATAVLLPFLLDLGASNDVVLQPTGDLPPRQ